MNRTQLIFTGVLAALTFTGTGRAEWVIRQIAGQAELGTVEIHNVGAGEFNPDHWRAGTLNIVPDMRAPMITPRLDGVFRNIYAPSAVQIPGGWRLFYGAWDGVHTGNDRIYCVTTTDFLTFDRWQTVIENGVFIHVCNVSAVAHAQGDYHLVCTAYPVGDNLNKPAAFQVRFPEDRAESASSAGRAASEPVTAAHDHLAAITGYEPFDKADMNGVNAILLEDGQYRLYFGDFKNWGHVHRASSADGKHFRYDGTCLAARMMVNDVKKFTHAGKPCYLMGLHANRDKLWYALSQDGMTFEPQQELAASVGPEDRYIVAIGWVVCDERLLGFVYGAGAVPGLDRNRLFARWLQKTVVFTDEAGEKRTATAALGPDRAILSMGQAKTLSGHLQILAEDARTPVSAPLAVKLTAGGVYRLEAKPMQ